VNVNTTRPAFPSNAATGLHEPEVAAANSVRPPAVAGLVGRRRGIRPAGLVAGEGHMADAMRQLGGRQRTHCCLLYLLRQGS